MISVLCVMPASNYLSIPNLDLWTKERNAYLYTGKNPVITHAPCQQWSRMKAFAKKDKHEMELAEFCFFQVNKNGGIFEHPAGSSFFKYIGADYKKIFSIQQSWFGFRAPKRTYLYCSDVKLLPHPLNFDACQVKVSQLNSMSRSKQTLSFCSWLVDSVKNSFTNVT